MAIRPTKTSLDVEIQSGKYGLDRKQTWHEKCITCLRGLRYTLSVVKSDLKEKDQDPCEPGLMAAQTSFRQFSNHLALPPASN